jgi:hypothetical protein
MGALIDTFLVAGIVYFVIMVLIALLGGRK